jgi:hypothetical protein
VRYGMIRYGWPGMSCGSAFLAMKMCYAYLSAPLLE